VIESASAVRTSEAGRFRDGDPGEPRQHGTDGGDLLKEPGSEVVLTGQRSNQRVWLNLVATLREVDLERP
jgi:hypothetical protein